MDWFNISKVLVFVQHSILFLGMLIIVSGILLAICRYVYALVKGLINQDSDINSIRLNLGRILILGLEFVVAADVIGITTVPDYYSVGILAITVLIRTLLSFQLSHEINTLDK